MHLQRRKMTFGMVRKQQVNKPHNANCAHVTIKRAFSNAYSWLDNRCHIYIFYAYIEKLAVDHIWHNKSRSFSHV